MIVTEKKEPGAILESLAGFKSVYIFGCGACAEQCRTGGKAEIEEISGSLTEHGISVVGYSLPDETCYNQLIRKEFRRRPEIRGADAVLVLSCGAGVRCVADNAAPAQPVVPALDTVYLSVVERHGRFFEGCSLCGDCVLGRTGAICPHTECPKGLLNGPCGGAAEGMCEVDVNHECAWALIYKRLEAQGRLDLIRSLAAPKDYSKLVRPRRSGIAGPESGGKGAKDR